jgi:arylsulfatase A-like enzyme
VQRRTFLIGSAATVGTAAVAAAGGGYAYKHRSRPTAGGPSVSTDDTRVYGSTTVKRVKASSDAPNVLFIALDDCNDWLGFLGNHPGTITPNLDALAAKSLSFTNAYCVAPMCNPARTGIMFGRQPFTVGVYDHSNESFTNYFAMAKQTPSLVDDMWASGYEVIGAGKVFNDAEMPRWNNYRATDYWADYFDRKPPTEPDRYDPNWLSPYDGKPEGMGENMTIDMMDFGPSGRTRDTDPEGQASIWVADRLKDDHKEPFFLAYGAICTHLPWRIPQQYFDMHPLDRVVLPPYLPEDLNDLSAYAKLKIIDTNHVFARLVQDKIWPQAVQAYQAAITYADDCVGRVLDQLAHSPYADNTIVVLWSDHGFHMGEKLHIEKFTIWEQGTHVPFLLHTPDKYNSAQTFDKPVSTLNVGPTLMDLVGGKVHATTHEGRSILPMLANPESAGEHPPVMTWQPGNHAVRKDQWRYIRYVTGDTELYDHSNDPDELNNLASNPDTKDIRDQLDKYLPPPKIGAAAAAQADLQKQSDKPATGGD